MAFIPTPDQFPTWQDWARHVVDVLSNDSSTSGSGSSPTISVPPPIKKILTASNGAYALSGNDVEFVNGPFQFLLQALHATYGLTGNDVQMLHSALNPLNAGAGAFTLSGGAATLSQSASLPTQGTAVTT